MRKDLWRLTRSCIPLLFLFSLATLLPSARIALCRPFRFLALACVPPYSQDGNHTTRNELSIRVVSHWKLGCGTHLSQASVQIHPAILCKVIRTYGQLTHRFAYHLSILPSPSSQVSECCWIPRSPAMVDQAATQQIYSPTPDVSGLLSILGHICDLCRCD